MDSPRLYPDHPIVQESLQAAYRAYLHEMAWRLMGVPWSGTKDGSWDLADATTRREMARRAHHCYGHLKHMFLKEEE